MPRTEYGEEEIRALITLYEELAEQRDTTRRGLRALVALADLDRALAKLARDPKEVVLLHGLLGLPTREAAKFLKTSHQSVAKRFRWALEEIHYLMNGGE